MATSSSAFAPGEVVVVPFPYSDRFAEKRRPALVVSNDRVHGQGYVWLVMITSAKHTSVAHDISISDIKRAGLTAPSVVRPTKITNVEPSRIVRRAGRLTKEQADLVFESVRSFIGR